MYIKNMILVIGATSFVGLPVIKELIAGGNTVRCLIRTGSNVEKLKSEIVRDLTDKLNSKDNLDSLVD